MIRPRVSMLLNLNCNEGCINRWMTTVRLAAIAGYSNTTRSSNNRAGCPRGTTDGKLVNTSSHESKRASVRINLDWFQWTYPGRKRHPSQDLTLLMATCWSGGNGLRPTPPSLHHIRPPHSNSFCASRAGETSAGSTPPQCQRQERRSLRRLWPGFAVARAESPSRCNVPKDWT